MLGVLWSIPHLMDDPRTEAQGREETFFRLPDKALVGVGLIAFCSMTGEGAMADWSTNYLLKEVRAHPAVAPLGLAAFSTAMTLGRLLGDWGRLKVGDAWLLLGCSLLALTGLSVALLVLQPWVVIGGLFAVGLGLSVVVPIAYSQAGSLPGLAPGVGIAMVTTIGYAGFLMGPPVIGFLADWQTLRVALVFVLCLFGMMAALSWRQVGGVRT
ncbi:MAG: MFS transporter [Bacteroidetes bacterium]|nr:MAG: MFS transporter [Bacteroidota bacterium]